MLDVSRHKAIFNPETFVMPVRIIGCGGMGSRVGEALIRMGVGHEQCPLHLYDGDIYESHNLANQYIDSEAVGYAKPQMLRHQLLMINRAAHIVDHNKNVLGDVGLTGVVFVCVDSMRDRYAIMSNAIEGKSGIRCVIETRMDAYVGISHCFDAYDKRQCDCWWLYWHSDGEAENIAGCSGPQSIISAIFGTTMLALKQFEGFARSKSTDTMPNRIYQDFEAGIIRGEAWPTT